MTGPVTPEAPHGPCGICEQCIEAGRIAWADQGGLHFFDAVERVGGCENGWGAPTPPVPAASRDRVPPQPVAERVNATETGGTEAPGETVVASSPCGACSAMRERAEAAEAALTVVRFWFEHDSGIQRALRERREWREEPGMLEAAAAALSSGVLR